MPCGVPWRPEEGARSPVAGVRGGCEPLGVDAGNQTQVLLEQLQVFVTNDKAF